MGCGCSGSTPAKNPRRTVTQTSPSQVPGGPGTPGYTWDGPKRPARRVEAGSGSKKK